MQAALEKLLKANKTRMMDLFRETDDDGSGIIDEERFKRALTKLGFKGSLDVAVSLCDHLDPSGSFMLSLTTLDDWLNDRERPDMRFSSALFLSMMRF